MHTAKRPDNFPHEPVGVMDSIVAVDTISCKTSFPNEQWTFINGRKHSSLKDSTHQGKDGIKLSSTSVYCKQTDISAQSLLSM